jgi:hypothetical protein
MRNREKVDEVNSNNREKKERPSLLPSVAQSGNVVVS